MGNIIRQPFTNVTAEPLQPHTGDGSMVAQGPEIIQPKFWLRPDYDAVDVIHSDFIDDDPNKPLTGEIDPAIVSGTRGNLVTNKDITEPGKWYWEVTVIRDGKAPASSTHRLYIGMGYNGYNTSLDLGQLNDSGSWGYGTSAGNGRTYVEGSLSSNTAGWAYVTGDVLGFTYDSEIDQLKGYLNNVLKMTIFTGIYETFLPRPMATMQRTTAATDQQAKLGFNFGYNPFVYSPPAGFIGLNEHP